MKRDIVIKELPMPLKPLKRLRSEKRCLPSETISNITHILHLNKIETFEHTKDHNGFFSTRLTLANDRLLHLNRGTNGKGLTPGFSRAGAYAELMERLQNGYFFDKYLLAVKVSTLPQASSWKQQEQLRRWLHGEDPFLLDPHEMLMTALEALTNEPDVLKYLFDGDDWKTLSQRMHQYLCTDKMLCVPFLDVLENRSVPIPFLWLLSRTNSNGMCAGNAPGEALIQGICEVFERYAMRTILLEQPELPRIPRELFRGHEIYSRIGALELASGWSVDIRDCGLKLGLPVVGVLLTDQKQGRVIFHLGSAPSPITALERCLTEIHQGGVTGRFVSVDLCRDPLARAMKENDRGTINQWVSSRFIHSAGQFPLSVLYEPEGSGFQGFDHAGSSDEQEDLSYLLEIIRRLGCRLLIRDVSFLGFPAYFVYIPGLSEYGLSMPRDDITWARLSRHISTLNDMVNASDDHLKDLAECLDEFYRNNSRNRSCRTLFFVDVPNPDHVLPPQECLIAFVFLRLQDYDRAFFYLNAFMETAPDREKHLPYICLRAAVHLKRKGFSPVRIEKTLKAVHGQGAVKFAMTWLTDPRQAFCDLNLPQCFDCDRCREKWQCRFRDTLEFMRNMRKRQEKWSPNPDSLTELFVSSGNRYRTRGPAGAFS